MGRSRERSSSKRRKEKKSKEKKRRRNPSEERIEEILATLSQGTSPHALLTALPATSPLYGGVPVGRGPGVAGLVGPIPGGQNIHVPSNVHTMMSASPYHSHPYAANTRPPQPVASTTNIDWNCRIYVGSIHFEANESIVREVFEQYVGPVKSLSLQPDALTGHHRGYCFVEFPTPEYVAKALNLPEGVVHIMGRPVKIGRPAQASSAASHMEMQNPYMSHRVAYPTSGIMNPYATTPSYVPMSPVYPHIRTMAPIPPFPIEHTPPEELRDPSHIIVLTYFILSIHENIAEIFQKFIIPEVIQFGPITKIILYNETTSLASHIPPLPRVLIQYEDLNHAMNCQEKLDRKTFGQRCIRAQFLPDSIYQKTIAPALKTNN